MAKSQESISEEQPSITKRQRGRPSSDAPTFPRDSLSKVLQIAESIEKNNAGKPYDRLDLAKSLDMSPASSGFRQLITSSSRYGITEGSYGADKTSLTELGSSIVAPTSDEQRNTSLRTALLTPDLFKNTYTYFDKKQIPREELFKNTLKKEFKVASEDVNICYEVIMENMKDFSLTYDIKGNTYLQLDKLSSLSEVITQEDLEESGSEKSDIMESEPTKIEEKQIPKQIFVAHGKNTKPLEQLKTILTQFKIP